jgi:hypothetical protein
MGCPEYGLRLEEMLTTHNAGEPVDSGFHAHVQKCASCREAFETGILASQLIREAQRPVNTQETFVTRVMAAIREQESRLSSPGTIWHPLELLASRVALAAAMLLLGLSFYVARLPPSMDAGSANGQVEIGAGLPERPTLPAGEDEILMSLADMDNGI